MSVDDQPSALGDGETGDRFYHGRVERLYRGTEGGVIRTASGRDIPFTFAQVTMVGPHRRFADLREGIEVGYDVSWTSKGLRVSVIRVFD